VVSLFLKRRAGAGIDVEYGLAKRFVPTVTTTETAGACPRAVTDTNRVVIAVAPEKKDVAPPTETAVREALRAGASATLTAWRDESKGKELMPGKPTPGSVHRPPRHSEIGVTILTPPNGVQVWLKPTNFKNDQIAFTAYAKGG